MIIDGIEQVVEDQDTNDEFMGTMEQIKELVGYAYSLIPDNERSIKARAQSYWYNQILGTVDGQASMHSMADTLQELSELGEEEGDE